jgi:hypothetical protein
VADRQTIDVAIDGQELAGTHTLQWQTMRREITGQGALGVANHTGLVGLTLNDHVAVRLWLHEDRNGYVVVDVLDGRTNDRIARVDVELQDMVPPRRGAKRPKKDRRFET